MQTLKVVTMATPSFSDIAMVTMATTAHSDIAIFTMATVARSDMEMVTMETGVLSSLAVVTMATIAHSDKAIVTMTTTYQLYISDIICHINVIYTHSVSKSVIFNLLYLYLCSKSLFLILNIVTHLLNFSFLQIIIFNIILIFCVL